MNRKKGTVISLICLASLLFHQTTFSRTEETMRNLRINQERLMQRINALAEIGKNESGGVNRIAFSEADQAGRKYVIQLMKAAGLKVRIDEAGNIMGRRQGRQATLPVIMFGSHTDSVPQGGKFDGPLGVLGAIECIEVLRERKIITNHPLEVVVFTDEEGGLVGSRSLVGGWSEQALEVVTQSGKTVSEGIRFLGGDPENITRAARMKGDIRAYVEIHIEQGQILDSKKIDIGVVEGIVGIRRWTVVFSGQANHAGTTPMTQRRDALVAAARFILLVNRIALETEGRQVGTVGRIQAEPGAANVVPGRVQMSLELRDLAENKIQLVYKKIEAESRQIARQTGTTVSIKPMDVSAIPALSHPAIRRIIAKASKRLGYSYLEMPSGAGHDAQNMAALGPMGMIFIPSVAGISHSPQEFSTADAISKGVNVLLHTILGIDTSQLD